MFSHATDTSKIAMAHLARFLDQREFGLIDCQMSTSHLASLGAREMSREHFSTLLQELTEGDKRYGQWPTDGARQDWS